MMISCHKDNREVQLSQPDEAPYVRVSAMHLVAAV